MPIIKMTLKGAVVDISESPYSAVCCLEHHHVCAVARAQSCANHMQHIRHLSLATYCVSHGMIGQLNC